MLAQTDRLAAALNERYRVERELGRGGMATVYLAEDRKHNRQVAIKVLSADVSGSIGGERFLREIALAARLNHPNIVSLFDSGEADGLLYYVMPCIRGETLRERLDREGALSAADVIAIVREVADALSYAHGVGIVHRDIKPENILLSDGHALVSDFGIARALDEAGGERLTATGLAIGTPAYMSPEQAAGAGAVDARSDIYSLACVGYEMLGGDPPFTGGSPHAIMARHAVDKPLPLRSIRPTVSEAVDAVLQKALAKVPGDRYATASDLADALGRAHTTGGVKLSLRPMLWLRHHSQRATAAVAIVALAALVGVLARQALAARQTQVASIAVLPFENLSGDTTQEYFTAGMADAMRGAIGQLGVLRVLSGSTNQYRNSDKSDSVVARELNVDALVRASVVQSGDSVHFQVRLIQARPSERLLWSQTYDRDVRGVLAMQGDAALGIAKTIDVELTPLQQAKLSRPRVMNPESYESYLRGMYFLNSATAVDARKGLKFFQIAVEKNPGDPLAYAGLALAYAAIAHGPEPLGDDLVYGRAAALRAIALDSTLAEAWSALAIIKMYLEWDWAAAEKAFKRAHELNPNMAESHFHYAWYLILFDRMDEAIAEHVRAIELDPFTPKHTAYLGQLYIMAGRVTEAIAEAQKARAMGGRGALARKVLARAYAAQGRYDTAIPLMDSAAAIFPGFTPETGLIRAQAGDMPGARRVLADLERKPVTPITALHRALLNGAIGNNDEYFRWINYEPHHAWVPWVRVMPEWTTPAISKDPRFQQLMRRANLQMPNPRLLASRR